MSWVAKNFQDYFINVITQRLGAQIHSDGIRHPLEPPYGVFEDQRSGQTTCIVAEGAHGCREAGLPPPSTSSSRRFRRHHLRDGLRLERTGLIAPILLPHDSGVIFSSVLSRKIKMICPRRYGNHGTGRCNDGVAAQHRTGEEPLTARQETRG